MNKPESTIALPEYWDFIEDLKARVLSARLSAARHVNRELILLYWDIGKAVVEKQRLHNWGDAVVELAARDLQKAFPATRCFSAQNLWRMKQFYLMHTDDAFLGQVVRESGDNPGKTSDREKLSQTVRELVAQVPWGHYANVLMNIESPATQLWYIQT